MSLNYDLLSLLPDKIYKKLVIIQISITNFIHFTVVFFLTSIRYFITALCSLFFLAIYSGEMVFESFDTFV